jgi:hypothetical protein
MDNEAYIDFFANLDRLRLPPNQTEVRLVATTTGIQASSKPMRIKGEFLKGPIPLAWLTVASRLKGKASLAVALAIWFEAGRSRCKEVALTSAILNRFGVNRKAKYRALESLENAGLISANRKPRRNPVITILDVNYVTT